MTAELVGTGLVAGTWTVDPSHSTVGFTVRHLMSKVRGTFADFSGTIVTIAGDGRLGALLNGKRAMLVKATTDFAAWRGDQVVYDNYTATSKYDLKRAGANVTAVMINPNQGFDHGFPVARPLETVRLIDAFLQGDVSASSAAGALGGAGVAVYPNGETAWETATFTGF